MQTQPVPTEVTTSCWCCSLSLEDLQTVNEFQTYMFQRIGVIEWPDGLTSTLI